MTIEAVLFTRLTTFAGLAALVGTRVYPHLLPQNVEMPAISYARVDAQRPRAMGVDVGIVRARFQFDCWSGKHTDGTAGSPDEARLVFEQLRGALQRWSTAGPPVVQIVFIEDERDFFERNPDTYRVQADFEVNYEE